MNGTAANLASIKPEIIWIPYSIFIVLTIAVLAFSFVRYHRRKIAKRKWSKDYADKNLQIKRARISGITCNSNNMRLADLASSMMHPDIFRLYSDFSIQSLPNFARHNMELKSSKSTEDVSIDVNKIVIDDWIELNELQEPRISNISAGLHMGSSEGVHKESSKGFYKDSAEDAHKDSPEGAHKDSSAEFHKDSSVGFHKDSSASFYNESAESRHNESSASFYKGYPATVHKESSESRHKESSASFYKGYPATVHKESSESRHKESSASFRHDLVEIGLDEVCESCKITVLQYHERRPHRLKTLSQEMLKPYDFEKATHQLTQSNSFVPIVDNELRGSEHSQRCRVADNRDHANPIMKVDRDAIAIVGNECFQEYQESLLRLETQHTSQQSYDNIDFTPGDTIACTVNNITSADGDIYAIPKKKRWTQKTCDHSKRYVKPTGHTDVPENTCATVASKVDFNRVLSQRKRFKNSKNARVNPRESFPKQKRSFHRKPIPKSRRVNSLSKSQAKRTSHSYVNTYHKRPGSQMKVATDYSSTTSSERQSDDEYLPYEEIWSDPNEFGKASDQNLNGPQYIHNDPCTSALTSEKRNTKSVQNRSKRLQNSRTNFHISQTGKKKFKETLNMESLSNFDTKVKMKLPHKLQRNSSSENSVTCEKRLLEETPQINSNSIETAKLSGELMDMESKSDPDIRQKMKVGLQDNKSDNPKSITHHHHQLIKCTTLENPGDQYFNYTDAEKMKQVAPKNIDNRSGDIYWLDIHNEDTMV